MARQYIADLLSYTVVATLCKGVLCLLFLLLFLYIHSMMKLKPWHSLF